MAISKTTPEALFDIIENYDRFRDEGEDHDQALKNTAEVVGINAKTARERFDAIHTTLEVWTAYEEGKISYSKLRVLGLDKLKPNQANFLLKQALEKDLVQRDLAALRKQVLAGEIEVPRAGV